MTLSVSDASRIITNYLKDGLDHPWLREAAKLHRVSLDEIRTVRKGDCRAMAQGRDKRTIITPTGSGRKR